MTARRARRPLPALAECLVAAPWWRAVRTRLPWRVEFAIEAAALAADGPSFRRLLGYRRWDPAAGVIRLRSRQLGGREVVLRAGASDLWALTGVLPPACHMPPPEVDVAAVRTVWDLGANIGLTMAHFAHRMPAARIVGVELDAETAALAARNVARFGDRCEVIRAAVWPDSGELAYAPDPGHEVGLHVRPAGDDSAGLLHAPALSLDALLEHHHPGGGDVDFVKMDIEGAEREVLRHNTGWARRVRALTVEVHPPYTVDECLTDLRALGFAARADERVAPGHDDGMPPVIALREE